MNTNLRNNIAYKLCKTSKFIFFSVTTVRCCGGVSQNDFICQLVADLCQLPIERVSDPAYAACLGTAFLAGLTVGFWRDQHELESIVKIGCVYTPTEDEQQRRQLNENFQRWQRAIDRSRRWYSGIEQQ